MSALINNRHSKRLNSIFLIENTPKWVNAFFIREKKHFSRLEWLFLWSLSEAKAFKESHERLEARNALFSNVKSEFMNFWRVWDKNAIFFTDASFRVLFERIYVHRGGDLIPHPFTLPRPLFIATPTKILACFSGFLHTHPSIDQESALWDFKGDQDFVGVALRAWPLGLAIARFAR